MHQEDPRLMSEKEMKELYGEKEIREKCHPVPPETKVDSVHKLQGDITPQQRRGALKALNRNHRRAKRKAQRQARRRNRK